MSALGCARTWEAEAVRDGRLTGDSAAAFERHATTCASCAAELDALHALAQRIRRVRTSVPDLTPLERRRQRSALLRRANDELLSSARPTRRRKWALLVALSVVLAIASAALARPTPSAAGDGLRAERETRMGELVRLAALGWATEPTIATSQDAPTPTPSAAVGATASATPTLITAPAKPATASLVGTNTLASGAMASASSAPPIDPAASFVAGMEAFHGAQYEKADALFATFIAQAKTDARVEDAAFLRAVAHARLGDRKGARALVAAYLAAYPDGLRRDEAQRLAASLAQ